MHYRHRLAKRASRHLPAPAAGAVGAIERFGVRATYNVHERVLSNPSSRKQFAARRPSLDSVQTEVVDRLADQGYCLMPFTRLFSEEQWEELAADAQRFDVSRPNSSKTTGKNEYLWRRYGWERPLTLDSPWLRLGVSKRMLGIVDTYLGMWAKLTYADQWYSPPQGADADRRGSMRWHRDYNDRHLVKVFVYLCDVDEGTGPFEYVPGSAEHGPFVDEWRWKPLSEMYPPGEEFAKRIPTSAARTFTAPRGTMIFANTSGFHRGGFVTEKPRTLFVYNYVSPAALHALVERNFEVPREAAAGLCDEERFALA